MDSQNTGSDLFPTSDFDLHPDLDQDGQDPPPPLGHSPSFEYSTSIPQSIPVSYPTSTSFFDPQLWPGLIDSPPPLDAPPATVSPIDLHFPTFQGLSDSPTSFTSPSTFPHVSYPPSFTYPPGPWIGDGLPSEGFPFDIDQFSTLLPVADFDSPTVVGSTSRSSQSGSPLDSELIQMLTLSNIFSPNSNPVPIPFSTDPISPFAVPLSLSPDHFDLSPPPSQDGVPFALQPPSVPTVDLSSSSITPAPLQSRTRASASTRRRSSHKRKTTEDDPDRDDDQPGSSSAPRVRRRRERVDPSPFAGCDVIRFDVEDSQASAADLGGVTLRGRVSLSPVDVEAPRCLHTKQIQKGPRHWRYNCKYNPNPDRVPCHDPTCGKTFASQSNMWRHYNKDHDSDSGSE